MKSTKKLIICLLVFAMIMQLMPPTALAVVDSFDDESVIASPERIDADEALGDVTEDNCLETLQNRKVLFEETSLREESVKHFRMEDGSFIAVDYQMPVHYLDENNEWTDYDNTLVAVENGEKVTAYRVENGDSVRTFAATDTGETLLSMQKGEYALTFSPETENKRSNDEEKLPAEAKDVKILQVSAGSAEEITEPLLAKTQPDKLYSALEYTDILDGVSLRYENYANTVKESIVIPAPQSDYSYTFRLTLKGLAPKTEEDGSIVLCSEEGNVIYTIPAPYMIDNNHEESYEAKYQLKEDGGEWLLTVTADSKWMNAEERAYPVMIDPTVTETVANANDVSAAYVRSGYPNAPDTTETGLYVGQSNDPNNPNKKTRSYIHINKLPELPTGCELMRVEVSLYQFAFVGSNSLDVGAYEIDHAEGQNQVVLTGASSNSAWAWWANALTWTKTENGSTAHKGTILDKQTLNSATGGYVSWDISTLAYKWYDSEYSGDGKYSDNLGFALRALNEDLLSRASFYGPKSTSSRPRITITYRNTAGIESMYSYQTIGIGRAGTSYISDFSLQNTLVVPIVVSSSEINPFSLSLVYNTVYGENYFTNSAPGLHTKSFSSMLVGVGWKLSAQQTVVSQSVGGVTYLIYNDADGTEHYFRYCSDGYYRDEDGLGLKITGSSSAYTMSDDYGNQKKFTYGILSEETDAYGNAIYYAYNDNNYSAGSTAWKPNSGSTNRLTSVWRKNTDVSAAEQLVLIGYNGNYVNTIISECDYTDETSKSAHRITLGRTSNGNKYCLGSIAYPDGVSAQYLYKPSIAGWNERFKLFDAYDAESNYGIEYSYSSSGNVEYIHEYIIDQNEDVEYGTMIQGQKVSHSQTVYRYFGNNTSVTSDDFYINKLFDSYGRTLESHTTDLTKEHILGASAATYTQNSGTNKTNNRLLSDVSTGQQGANLLKNCRLDNASVGINEAASWTPDGTGARLDTAGHYAENSLMLTRSAYTSTKDTWYQSVESLIPAGEYTFSAYVKVPSTTTFGTDGGVYLEIYSLSGGQYLPTSKSEVINYSTESFCDGWVRICLTFAAPQSGTVRVALSGANYKGLILADDFQLESEKSAATFNLMVNASFEESNTLNSSSSCGLWYKTGNATISTTTPTYFGDNSACLSGSGQQRANQNITLNLPLTTTFILSGWAKADALPGSKPSISSSTDPYYGLIIRLYYSDNTSEVHYYPFDPYFTDWQYVQGILVPEKTGNVTITEAAIVAAYDNNINKAWMDNISLRIEPAQTYRYDENGNIVAATQAGAGSQGAVYSGVDLTQYTSANGNKITYTYNGNKHDIATAKVGSLTNTFTYNSAGNMTKSKVTATGEAKYLESTATPTGDRNHTASVTDANGNTATYTYNGYLEKVDSVTDSTGQTIHYSYTEENGRMSSTYQTGVAEVTYAYENGNLKQLTRKTKVSGGSWKYQYYYLLNNDWGQLETLMVGNQELTSNEYRANGGPLTKTTYGNGQYATYTYDEFDRLTDVKYNNNGRFIHYTYNSEGALSKLTYGDDTIARGSYQFEYDSLGRLIRSAEYDGSGTLIQRTEHNYDAYNRLSSQSWILGTKTYSESYSYSDGENGDGSLTSMSAATGDTVDYDYDNLKRLHQRDVYIAGSTTPLSTVYGYRTVSGNRSSAQVEYYNVVRGSNYSVKNKYTYDARGNITAVYEDVTFNGTYRLVSQYTYDAQNQLTKEIIYNYGSSGNSTDTYEYAYDTAGNIQTVKKNGTTTQSYSYSNDNWKDQLSSITSNGSSYSILYDNSGNPTTYRRGTNATYYLTWSNGRQLTRTVNGGTTTNYTYDADGIRTWKKVGSVNHYYVTQNGKVVRETIGSGSTAKVLDFIYDESGRPFALNYSTNNGSSFTTYYYILNLQGDVVKLVNASGTSTFATYTYDAWGKLLSSSGSLASVNPLRYRGYYYDTETGWYYLQSRYYDPVIHRFINADCFASTGQGFLGCNMFAYCNNNPTGSADSEGGRPYNVNMTDGGGGKPAEPVPLDSPSKDFYEQNKQEIDADIIKYSGSSATRIDIVQSSSKVVNRETRVAEHLEGRRADAIMSVMLCFAIGPASGMYLAKSIYGAVTGATEVAGTVIDLYNGTNNVDGEYQTYTVFVDTQETVYGVQMTKTTVIRYLWYKHKDATSWTMEWISTDYYYSRG